MSLLLAAATLSQAYAQNFTLSTNFGGTTTGGNGGNMFDLVVGATPITVTRFDVKMSSTAAQTVNVYYKTGTYVGSQTTIGNWTLHESVATTGAGSANPTPVTLTTPLALNSSTTYGIAVVAQSTALQYNSITSTVQYSDANITIQLGAQVTTTFGSSIANREWNGTIYYTANFSDSTLLTASNTATSQFNAPVTNQVVMDMQAATFVNNNNLNSITFARAGTVTDSDISAVTLYRDNNNDGVVDAGDTQLASGTLTSGTVTFSGSPTLQAITVGTPVRLLLAITVPSALTPGVNVQFSATAATWSGAGTDLTSYPVSSGMYWITNPEIPFHIYYKFNEGSGTTTQNDAIPGSGSNPVTLGAGSGTPTWVTPGRLGASAIDFDVSGAAGFGTGYTGGLSTNSDWTIETWVRLHSTDAGYVFRFVTGGFTLYYTSTNGLHLLASGLSTTSNVLIKTPAFNVWQHVALVYDSTAQTITVYVDGAQDSVTNTTANATGELVVGSFSTTSTSNLHGEVDEFRVWDKIRTPAEIVGGMFQELPIQDSAALIANTTKAKVSTPVTSLVALDVNAYAIVSAKTLNSLTFSRTGTALDTDFSNITLYLDNNGDGIVDGGDTTLGTGTLSGGTMTINCSPAPSIAAGTSVRLLLAVDVSSTLSPGTTFQFSVTAAAFSAGTDFTAYPLSGANWTVRTPVMPFNLYYKMNEGSGSTTANDAIPGVGSRPAPIGPTTAPTWVAPGAVGSHALDFSTGNGSGISTGWTDGVSGSDDWTIEMWMRLNATTAGYPFRFVGGGLYLYMTGGNFTLYGTGSGSNPSWAAPALNVWQHVAIVYDATAGTVTVYLDGTLSSFVSGKSPTGRGELIVGSFSATGTRFYGQLDEFRFWDVPRSAAEIAAAMNIELPSTPATRLKASTFGDRFPTVPATDMVVMDMQADAFINNNSITSITFTHIGTAPDTDLTAVKLYRDNNGDGAVDAGDTLLGTGTLSAGEVTFSGAPMPQALTAGTTVRLLLAVDTSAGFTMNNTIQFQVTNSADITWGAGPDLTAFPVVGGEWEHSTLVTRQYGAPTTTNTFPFNSGTAGWRFQNAYSAAEINMPSGSVITEIRISSATIATPTYNNLRIRLAHTTLAVNALTTTFEANYSGNLATCLGPVDFSPIQNVDGYYVFPLSIPFLYNGVDGILIDWSFDSRTGGGFSAQTVSGVRSRAYVSGTSANYLSPTASTLNTTGADFFSQIDFNFFAPSPQPIIQMSRTASISNGGTDSVGNLSLQGDSFTWTIANAGTSASLNIVTPIEVRPVSGSPTVNIISQPASSVAGTTQTTFTLQVIPSAPGAFSFQVWITNDDLSDNPFVFTVSGSGIAPDMEVSRGASPVIHTGTDNVGNVPNTGLSFTWTISNTSVSDLQITTPISVTPGTGTPGWSVTTQPATSVPQGTPTSFTILITPSPGAFDLLISIANNDPANNPYTFTVSGTGIAPDMEISRTAAITSGSTDNVGNVSTAGQSFNWTIDNSGNHDLLITTPITVTPGTGAPGFSVTAQPASTVGQSGTTSFTINITPSVGNFDLLVSIASNDPVNNPYTFTISGIGFIPNGPAVANPASGSIFSGAVNGPFTTAIVPGGTLANATIELTDPENDNITVTAITAITATPTGITAPAIPGTPGHPVTLAWTGTADASNTPGDYTWEVTFEDAVNGTPVTVEVTITIGDLPPTHAIANALGGDGTVGTPYTINYTVGMTGTNDVDLATVTDPNVGQALTVTNVTLGGTNPRVGSFNLTLAGGFLNIAPNGSLLAADVGTHTFDVEISDGTNDINIHVSATVAAAPAISTTSPLPTGEQGQNYLPVNIVATGGTGTLTFAVSAGSLPPGITLSATGVVAGLPSLAGVYNFTVTATDTLGISDQEAFALTIDPPAAGTPTITTLTLPAGVTNTTYGPVTLQVNGGLVPYAFSITGGNLPTGVTMSAAGLISGIPTTQQIANFEVTVTDSAFASSSANLSITVNGPAPGSGSGGGGGGCVASNSSSNMWGLLLGALALLGVVLRVRAVRD